jgi:hypothetical protein
MSIGDSLAFIVQNLNTVKILAKYDMVEVLEI